MRSTVIEPVRQNVMVDCDIEHAFAVFTERLAEWWPLTTHSLGGERATGVVLEPRVGGEVYETIEGGQRVHWADVLVWEPPRRIVIAWMVNPERPAPTEVEVTFTPEGSGTRVALEHRGWERLDAEGQAGRASYAEDWPGVLARFAAAAGRR